MELALRIVGAAVGAVIFWREAGRAHGMPLSKMLLIYFCGVTAGGGWTNP